MNTSSGELVRGFTRSWGEPAAGLECVSAADWSDSRGLTCKVYERNLMLCNVGVEYLPGYLPADHDEGYTSDALQAKMACCVCGGGDWVEYSFLATRIPQKKGIDKCLGMS